MYQRGRCALLAFIYKNEINSNGSFAAGTIKQVRLFSRAFFVFYFEIVGLLPENNI